MQRMRCNRKNFDFQVSAVTNTIFQVVNKTKKGRRIHIPCTFETQHFKGNCESIRKNTLFCFENFFRKL